MAGFFDTLFGSENEPDRRDYKRMDEITTPEELEAYRSGESATGSFIPGLDYARSMARGARREITDPSMGPLGERYQEEMDRYRRRQAEFERLKKLYPEAVRGGQLRGTENIPGAEAAFMAQPLAGGAARVLTRGAMRNVPQMAEREVGAFPRGWDLHQEGWQGVNPGRSHRTTYFDQPEVAATSESGGNWPSLDTYNPGRTNKWRERVFKEPSLNPTRSMAQEMHPGEVVPEAPTFTPAPARVNRAPSPVVQSYWDRLSDLPQATRNDLLMMRQTGQKPSGFRMNAINSALAKRGVSLSDILGETEGTLSPNVYGSMTKESLSGVPMNPRERAAAQSHIQTFRPATDADIGTRRTVRSPLASGMNEPDLQFSPTVNENIANRQAAQEAKNERFARLPPVLQTNAFYKQANRLLEGGEEARDLITQRLNGRTPFRNVAPDEVISGMSEASGYRPPEIVRRWGDKNTNLLPNRGADALNKALDVARNVDPRWGVGAGAAGASLLGAKMLNDQRGQQGQRTLPDIDIKGGKAPAAISNAPLPYFAANPNAFPAAVGAPENKIIAETAREAGAPRPPARPRHIAAPPAARTAPRQRPVASDERYYGDWRDTEPFASDPIGNLIDEIVGRKKASKERGSMRRSGGLGDLLPFEKGGVVSGRHNYADGGIPILSDLGDSLGGLFGEGATAPKAQDEEVESSGDVGMSPLKQALIAAGLGMMAASRPGTGVGEAIGAGGLKGFELYQSAQKLQSDLRQKEQARKDRLREMRLVSGALGDDADVPVAADEAPASSGAPSTVPMPKVTLPAPKEAAAQPTVETADIKAPSGAPISPTVVASDTGRSDASLDAYLERLRAQHRKADKILPYVSDPAARAALANRQRSIEFEIRDLREQREKSVAERRYAEESAEKRKKAEEEAFSRSPQGVMEKVRGETGAKTLVEHESEIPKVNDTLQTLDRMETLLNEGMYSGPGAETAATVGTSPLTTFAPDTRKSAERAKEFDRISKDIVYLAADKKLNAGTSNADIQFLKEKGPNLGLTNEGNKMAIDYLRRAAERKLKIIEFEQQYVRDHGYLDKNFYTELKKWGEENPLFPEREKKAGKATVSVSENALDKLVKKYPQYTKEQLKEMYDKQKQGRQ